MYLKIVECLECDNHYGEVSKFIPVCPHCGNNDADKTIYLSEEGDIYKTLMQTISKEKIK